MNNRELKTIIKLFENSTLESMKLEREDVTIELSKPTKTNNANTEINPTHNTVATTTETPSQGVPSVEPEEQSSYEPIKAPLVGTYYEAAGPDQPPFVRENQTVKKGDTVCIIEAMKVMNEITAPRDGKIVNIHVKNGEMVMVDQVIMEIE
ncbi:MAG: acetyl-CoA carboxylase biotin carboxyl carrier protein [Bacillota bacterium]